MIGFVSRAAAFGERTAACPFRGVAEHTERFRDADPALLGVARLAFPDLMVEIEATAVD
jgi:hypothetical protein